VGAKSKNGGAVWGLVTAYSLKDAGAVVDDVTHDVNRRVFPINELSVAPDAVVVVDRH
jgi:hypothetical protein